MKRAFKIILIIGSVLIVGFLIYWFIVPRFDGNLQQGGEIDSASFAPPVPRLYGLAVDSFIIETDRVKRDQNLGEILQKYNLHEGALAQLLLYTGDVFDVRKIRYGNNYTAFLSRDTLYQLQYFVYEHTPVDYVLFDFRDSVQVFLQQKEITTRIQSVSSEIETSLWNAIVDNNIKPQIANDLSDIYAWTIDFFGLQPGDHFTVIFDELFVDTVSFGVGRIHAASFTHSGKEILAIPFTQDSVETYFDGDGNSLRRTFLKAPLRFNRISSRFSASRLHPILKIRRPHYGVDYAAPIGTPVYAIGDGRVIMAEYQSGSGRIVKIRHNSVYTTAYMHLSSFGKGIKVNKYVSQGELIGYVGSSGLSTGPHLDFRVSMNGSPIDPLKMESPPEEPIEAENIAAFDSVKAITINLLREQKYRLALSRAEADTVQYP